MKYLLIILIFFISSCEDHKTIDKSFKQQDLGNFNEFKVSIVSIKNGDTLYYYTNGQGSRDEIHFYLTEDLRRFNVKDSL